MQFRRVNFRSVTNDDITAKLLVKKHVINDSGRGTRSAGFFQIQVDVNGGVFTNFVGDENGTLVDLPRDATYSVVEISTPSEYTVSYSADCTGTIRSEERRVGKECRSRW